VAARVESRWVDSPSPAGFDADRYSAPTGFARHRATAVASVDTVRVVAGDRAAAAHPRCRGRGRASYDPVHHPAAPGRKPGASDFAAPPEGRELPVAFGAPRRRPEAELGGPGTRRFIKVLRLLERAGLGELTGAIGRAPGPGVADADAVRPIPEHRREQPVGLSRPDGRPHLKAVSVPMPDLSAYTSPTAGVAP
jgi:hypothetical protein